MVYCANCGLLSPQAKKFCAACGNPFLQEPASIVVAQPAPALTPDSEVASRREFNAFREPFFWIYLTGFLFIRQIIWHLDFFGVDVAGVGGFVVYIEAAILLVAVIRGRHNWLVLWFFLLIASTLIGFAERADSWNINYLDVFGEAFDWLWHLVLLPLIVFFYFRLTKRLERSPWSFSGEKGAW